MRAGIAKPFIRCLPSSCYQAGGQNYKQFIANEWKMAWFSDQKYDPNIFQLVGSAVRNLKTFKALKSFERWWNQEPSVLDIPRSSMVCERCVKEMEEVYSTSRNDEYLKAKFIVKNSLK